MMNCSLRLLLLLGFVWLMPAGAQAQGLDVWVDPGTHFSHPGAQFRTVAHANGGTAPYRFEWYVGNERTGTINQAKMWKLNTLGTFPIRVVVTDSAGRRAEARCAVEVTNNGRPVAGSPAPTPPPPSRTTRPTTSPVSGPVFRPPSGTHPWGIGGPPRLP